MCTEVTGSVQLLSLEAAPCRMLIDSLQALLAMRPTLTLVVLVGEASGGLASDALDRVKTCMDDVERLLFTCLRRSDRVVRCGETGCAAVLFDADGDGALRAMQRFQPMLDARTLLHVSLRIGFAAAPEQTSEGQALLALALKPRLSIQAAPDARKGLLPRMDEIVEGKPAAARARPKGRGARGKARKATIHLREMLPIAPAFSAEPARPLLGDGSLAPPDEMHTWARARILGVPYIAPPQHIPSSVLNLLSVEVMHQLRCLPIGRDRNMLTVALADPTDKGVLQRLEQMTGLTIFPVMTDPGALEALAQSAHSRHASPVASSTPLSGD
jgi:hypothetical protein